jgi:hypothetical protein
VEKLGMPFSEKFRYTEDQLQSSESTHHLDDVVIWDGFDVRHTLTKEDWLAHRSRKQR